MNSDGYEPIYPGLDTSLYELNLEYLRRYYSDLYETIVNRRYEPMYRIRLGGDPQAPGCQIQPRTSTAPSRGDRGLIHGASPWKEAQHTAEQIPWRQAGLIFVLNTGLGYTARLLSQQIYLYRLNKNQLIRLVFVEEDIELFRRSLYLHNWTRLFAQSENLFIAGVPLSKTLHHPVLNSYPPVYQEAALVIPGGHLSPRETKEITLLTQEAQNRKECAGQYIQNALHLLHNRREFFRPVKRPKRILFLSHYMIPMQNMIMNILKTWGYECKLIPLLNDPKAKEHAFGFYRKWAWLDMLNDFKPDALFMLTDTADDLTDGSDLSTIPIPKIVWFLDDPLRQIRFRDRRFTERKNTFLFCYDKTHLDNLRRLGFRHVFYQPFGASFGPDFQGLIDGETHPGVTYAGSILGEVEILNRWLFAPYMPELIPILQQAGEEIAAGKWRSEHEWIEENGIPDERLDRTIYVRYLQDYITNKKRISILSAAVEFNLRTYGSEMFKSELIPERLRKCYQEKRLHYTVELPGIYAHSAVNLNINHCQSRTGVQARIYDALSVGGFLLTDSNPSIEEEFDIGKELICYHSPDELKDLLRFYLNHESERRKIAQAGQRVVLEKYTLEKRLKQIFQKVEELVEE